MSRAFTNHVAPAATSAAPHQVSSVATAKTHARRVSSEVLVFVNDNGVTRLIRAKLAHQSELSVLSPTEPAEVQLAVLTMHVALHGGTHETNA